MPLCLTFASSLDNTFRKLKIDETKFDKDSYMHFQSLFKNFKVKNGKITINLKVNDSGKLKDGVKKIEREADGNNDDKDKDSNNIEEGFRISGLGQLVEAGIQADRLITFGD